MNEISIKKEHIHAPFLILILFYCNFKQTVATLIFHTIHNKHFHDAYPAYAHSTYRTALH